MKILLPCLLLTGVLFAGLAIGLRPPGTAKSAAVTTPPPAAVTSTPPGPAPAVGPGVDQPSADARRPADTGFIPTVCGRTTANPDRTSHGLLPGMVARDPAGTGHLELASEPGDLRDELLRQFVRHWAATDIGSTITWVTSLLDETDRQNAATALTAQVAEDDPAGAIELAQLLHIGLDDGSLERLAQLWTEEKPREALDWIVRRPADPLRDRLLARIAWTRAQREPAEAAGLLLNHMTPSNARDEALISVVRQWAVRDPAPATAWVASFPAGPLHSRALAELANASKVR